MLNRSWRIAAIALVVAAVPLHAQQFTNGSLTGPIANGNVPTGWSTLLNSPDTVDPNNNVGVPGLHAFGATPSASPNGGTWVGVGAQSGGYNEAFGQTVAGLTVGQSYTVSWFASNFGYADTEPAYVGPNFFQMLVNGSLAGSGASIALGTGWFAQSVSFVATTSSNAFRFQLGSSTYSYLGIDGISLAQSSTTTTPEPASLALVAFGCVAVAFARRRRA
ncbi:MAG: PEP-CTERM sorting domain-containing protein [Gemmatimonadaceae bacterium]